MAARATTATTLLRAILSVKMGARTQTITARSSSTLARHRHPLHVGPALLGSSIANGSPAYFSSGPTGPVGGHEASQVQGGCLAPAQQSRRLLLPRRPKVGSVAVEVANSQSFGSRAGESGPDAAHAIVQAAIDGGIGGIALPTGALPLHVAAWSLARYFKQRQVTSTEHRGGRPGQDGRREGHNHQGRPGTRAWRDRRSSPPCPAFCHSAVILVGTRLWASVSRLSVSCISTSR